MGPDVETETFFVIRNLTTRMLVSTDNDWTWFLSKARRWTSVDDALQSRIRGLEEVEVVTVTYKLEVGL